MGPGCYIPAAALLEFDMSDGSQAGSEAAGWGSWSSFLRIVGEDAIGSGQTCVRSFPCLGGCPSDLLLVLLVGGGSCLWWWYS